MTETRYSKVAEDRLLSLAPSKPKRREPDSDPPESSKGGISLTLGKLKAHIPTAIVSAALAFGGTLFARPHVDVSRIETRLDKLDGRIGAIGESVSSGFDAVRKRQADDSDKFTNAIRDLAFVDTKHEHQLERMGDQYLVLAARIERVEHR